MVWLDSLLGLSAQSSDVCIIYLLVLFVMILKKKKILSEKYQISSALSGMQCQHKWLLEVRECMHSTLNTSQSLFFFIPLLVLSLRAVVNSYIVICSYIV